MENFTKEQLEALLYAFKLLEKTLEEDDRLSIKTIIKQTKEAYVKLVMEQLNK